MTTEPTPKIVKKASEQAKIAISARLDAVDFYRTEAVCKARKLTMAEFIRVAVVNETSRVAGALPNKEPTLLDIDKRLDAIAKQLETDSVRARESDKSLHFIRRMIESVCVALGLKAVKE